MYNAPANLSPFPLIRPQCRDMTSPLSPGASVRDLFQSQAPDRLAAIERFITPAPHARPPAAIGRGLDLQHLDHCTQGLVLKGLPVSIQRASRARQLTFVGGRLCAETAMRDAVGRCEPIAIGEGGAPRWPVGVTGSIAHTGDGAWAVVGPFSGDLHLGIDSERIVDEGGMRDIVALCCTPWERERWFDPMSALRATLLFSGKECVYKAIHPQVQRFVDFDEVQMTECAMPPPAPLPLEASTTLIADSAHAAGSSFRLSFETKGDLASQLRSVHVQARVIGSLVHSAVVRIET
ncbi:4'-phosphopantetheinyl transferase family protein [Roseateles amylovorans]|uniref:Enterobactin synthase component D n=1 Tax=Roseateles amylovorans TaxID=2978473 RepID=A0ABY6AV92_9BURK|nr:4'-phosphopantetheinyl transferase superfamily protein [Roseateles amylovorans]UXH76228.1 4'-phosphopantetheinyl transferase superfamily protein [Roseateles amylovorans]